MALVRSLRGALMALALAALATATAQGCVAGEGEGQRIELGGASCLERSAEPEDAGRTFHFTLPEPPRPYRLVASSGAAEPVRLCLIVAGVESCRSGASPLLAPDLVLGGAIAIRLDRPQWPIGTRYRIAFEPSAPPAADREIEPNDQVPLAHRLAEDLTVRGSLSGREQDVFLVEVTGAPQLWRVQVVGAGVERLALLDVRGGVVQARDAERGGTTIRLSNLLLLPGSHWIAVSGAEADYALRLLPLGPPEGDASAAAAAPMSVPATPQSASVPVPLPSGPRPVGVMEREPNDDASRAHLLRPGEPMVGLLAEEADYDLYRIAMPAAGYGRLSVIPSAEGAIRVDAAGLRSTPGVGEAYRYEGLWLAGDHTVTLRATVVADGYYQVLFELIDPFALPDDVGPNAAAYQAAPLPVDGRVVGVVGEHGASDHFLLPLFERETEVRFVFEGAGVSADTIRTRGDAWVASVDHPHGGTEGSVLVPAGGPYVVRVQGRGSYALQVVVPGEPHRFAPRGEAPEVELRIEGASALAAFVAGAQRLTLDLVLTNRSSATLALELDAVVAAAQWTLRFEDPTPTLAPAETRRVALHLEAAPWVRDDLPVALHVAARHRGGGPAVSARHDLVALCGATPVAPLRRWPLPEPLLGGFDVAAVALGALPQTTGRRELLLYSGRVQPGDGWRAELSEGPTTTVALAGDPPPRVLGVVLHPLSDSPVAERVRDFRLWTSLDGVRFEIALEGRLSSEGREQAFVFEAATPARFARLEVLSRQDGRPAGNVGLGMFKVIAEPGIAPLPAALDVGHPNLGGHVVDAEPFLRPLAFDGSEPNPRTFRPAGREVFWVVGFLHGRAGLIEGFEWHPHARSNPQQAIPEVRVSVASDTPLGPWVEVGSWRPFEQPRWQLDAPLWARYVRFEASGFDPAQAFYEFPSRLAIFERGVGPEYRSLVGEWGYAARDASWEWLHPTSLEGPPAVARYASQAEAFPLVEGVMAVAAVAVAEFDAWFALEVPEGANWLQLRLSGDPAPRYRWRLLDAAGAEIDAEVSGAGDERVLEAFVAPGRYFLHTWEPKRSVVFSWDDSGSMGPYIDVSYQAVASYVRALDPEREELQLQAFGSQPRFLLPDWTSDPEVVLATLTRYPRDQDSSEVELNLGFVVEQLAQRDGAPVVVLITDAGGSFGTGGAEINRRLWDAIEAVRPQVFSFETDSGGSFVNQARMQDWAYSAGGAYDYTRTMTDFDVGLAQVQCQLRQPKRVAVVARSEARALPGPGSLRVVMEDPTAALPTVMVVLDASGSMGKTLPGSRTSRWEAAQAVVQRLLSDQLPDALQFGLRVYGHRTPASCDTELVLPVAALDRARARSVVANLEPKLLSGTPLAASIEALIEDLGAVRSVKRVVVVTDGEESCGGDPGAAVAALRAAFNDVEVTIVGFDLDAEDQARARERFETWARLGGGRYLEASDEAALLTAITVGWRGAALFEVLSPAGEPIAEGEVGGEAVVLPAGRYLVRLGGPGGEVTEVRVAPERASTLTLSGP